MDKILIPLKIKWQEFRVWLHRKLNPEYKQIAWFVLPGGEIKLIQADSDAMAHGQQVGTLLFIKKVKLP